MAGGQAMLALIELTGKNKEAGRSRMETLFENEAAGRVYRLKHAGSWVSNSLRTNRHNHSVFDCSKKPTHVKETMVRVTSTTHLSELWLA